METKLDCEKHTTFKNQPILHRIVQWRNKAHPQQLLHLQFIVSHQNLYWVLVNYLVSLDIFQGYHLWLCLSGDSTP